MDVDIEDKNRTVIPRWRDFRTTLALGELKPSSQPNTDDDADEGSLKEQLADWQKNRSLAFATDLVGAGFVLGKTDEVEEAADFILSNQSQATELQKRIARQAKDPDFCQHLSISREVSTASSEELISQSKEHVRKYRAQLREAPRNPIKLVDLSLEYAILGSLRHAVRTMDMAVALAPANRFVLRSAARLFVHAQELDKAHSILQRAPSLRSDPWLLAAEIAVSSLRERTSSHIQTGMHHINSGDFGVFDVSELASAIATIEMYNANGKLARKLFRKALRRPTDNSIAQAEWASRSMQNLSVEVRKFDAPRKYEAQAWSHFKQEEWEDALNQGKGWIFDQPFAASPILFSGLVASVLEKFDLSERIYRFGLSANPQHAMMRNNLAFALASNDQPELAEMELEKIDRTSQLAEEKIVLTATEGLIQFRKGFYEEGRALYRCAIDLAQENKLKAYSLRALVFLAREEIHARTELAKPTLEKAVLEIKSFVQAHELNALLRKLESTVTSNPELFPGNPREVKRIEKSISRAITKTTE